MSTSPTACLPVPVDCPGLSGHHGALGVGGKGGEGKCGGLESHVTEQELEVTKGETPHASSEKAQVRENQTTRRREGRTHRELGLVNPLLRELGPEGKGVALGHKQSQLGGKGWRSPADFDWTKRIFL